MLVMSRYWGGLVTGLFAVAALIVGPPQAPAAAAPVAAELGLPGPQAAADVCDGWKIVSADYIRDRFDMKRHRGAVHLLRNYCHAEGDDYIIWVGRGFSYDRMPRGNYLNVQLQNSLGDVKVCTLNGGHEPNAYCTPPPFYVDLTSGLDRVHATKGTMWQCGPGCGDWYAWGATLWR